MTLAERDAFLGRLEKIQPDNLWAKNGGVHKDCVPISSADRDQLLAMAREGIAAEGLRETNKKLNRRVTALEGAVRQMWDACRVDGVQLSRRHDRAWEIVRELEAEGTLTAATARPEEG